MSGPEEASLAPGAPALYTELVRHQTGDTGGRKVSHEYVDPDTVRRMRNTGANIRNMGNVENIMRNNKNVRDKSNMEVTSNLRSIENMGNIECIMRNIEDRRNMEVTSNLSSMRERRMMIMEEDNGNMEDDTGDSRVRLDTGESGKTEYFFMQGSDSSPCNITYQSSRPRVQSIMDKIE